MLRSRLVAGLCCAALAVGAAACGNPTASKPVVGTSSPHGYLVWLPARVAYSYSASLSSRYGFPVTLDSQAT